MFGIYYVLKNKIFFIKLHQFYNFHRIFSIGVTKDFHSGFSIISYRKTQTNFFANPVVCKQEETEVIPEVITIS